MYGLALLHAAARCERVIVRGAGVTCFVRRPAENSVAFYDRLRSGKSDERWSDGLAPEGPPVLAMLYRGDIDLPVNSSIYSLFCERTRPTLAAGDLLS